MKTVPEPPDRWVLKPFSSSETTGGGGGGGGTLIVGVPWFVLDGVDGVAGSALAGGGPGITSGMNTGVVVFVEGGGVDAGAGDGAFAPTVVTRFCTGAVGAGAEGCEGEGLRTVGTVAFV